MEEEGYSYPAEDFNDESAKLNPYSAQQERLVKRKEKAKEAHKPKEEIEEYDNLVIPLVIKNKLDIIQDELKSRNKENRAIAYAMSIANDTIEKLQKDLEELTEVVKDLKVNSNVYMMQDDDEAISSKDYNANVDIDIITGNILRKIKDDLADGKGVKTLKKRKFDLSRKELITYFLLFLLISSNSYFLGAVDKILSFGSKDSLSTKHRVVKGDYAVCTTKNDKTIKRFALKENSNLNVEKTTDGKIWFIIGEYSCYRDSINKN